MGCDIYSGVAQTRTTIGSINTWVALVIPSGARDPLIGMENSAVTFRVSTTNSLNPSTQGTAVPATGYYVIDGVNVATITLYISADTTTTAILQYVVSS